MSSLISELYLHESVAAPAHPSSDEYLTNFDASEPSVMVKNAKSPTSSSVSIY